MPPGPSVSSASTACATPTRWGRRKSNCSLPTWLPTATSRPARRTRRSTPCCFCISRCWGSSCRGWTRCGRSVPNGCPPCCRRRKCACLLNAVEGGAGPFRLMARLLYGTGLRRQEGCQVRVHDLDLVRHQLTVRHGKGGKDRVVMLPRSLAPDLQDHLVQRRQWHEADVSAGQAYAPLPFALARKFPRAAAEFGWQFVFAARQRSPRPEDGERRPLPRQSRHARPGRGRVPPAGSELNRRAGCHTLRAQFRDPPCGTRRRYPHSAALAGAREPGNHDGLHACRPAGRGRRGAARWTCWTTCSRRRWRRRWMPVGGWEGEAGRSLIHRSQSRCQDTVGRKGPWHLFWS